METKEEYIKELKEEYSKLSSSSIDEIVKVYEARFELGKQAQMSEKEVIDMLKSPHQAAEDFIKEKAKNQIVIKEGEFKSIEVNLVADNLEIISSDELSQIKIDFNDADFNNYTIDTSNQIYALRFTPKMSFFSKMQSSNLKLYIPSSCNFEKIIIMSTASKVSFSNLKGKNITFDSVSGKIDAKNIEAETLNLKFVSGKGEINNISSKNLNIKLVSGKIEIEDANVENLNFGSVSGSCVINKGNVSNSKVSSLSGKLIISGKRL